MPDITANKPSAGAPIESSWGGEVHDILEALTAGATKWRMQWGVANINFVSNSEILAITFPVAFSATPVFFVANLNTSSALYFAQAASPSATGMSLRVTHRDGAGSANTLVVGWFAIGAV